MGAFLVAGLAAAVAIPLVLLLRLALADADLHLLFKGRHSASSFQGKVIWITGASQGLGKVLALHFAKLGAKLILSSRSRDKLEVCVTGRVGGNSIDA